MTDESRLRRLRRILERDPEPAAPEPAGRPGDGPDLLHDRIRSLRAEIERVASRTRDRPGRREDALRMLGPGEEAGPAVPIPGEMVRGPLGDLWMRERRYEPGALHGTAEIMAGLGLAGEEAALIALDEGLRSFDMRRSTFLDVETTGLSLGTGTIAFLVGLGWFADGGFCVRQLFVDRIENEPAVLGAMIEALGPRPMLVTFNGKSFDVPVLRSRLTLCRMDADLGGAGHLDLLHASRRLWKRRIGDCSLDSCERAVLGLEREGDVPGELIPEIFLEYLQTGSPGRIPDVFHHNLLDVVSMAALAGRMSELVQSRSCGDMDDVVSLAHVRLRHGEREGAEKDFACAAGSTSSDHRIESNLALAILARRRGEHALAASLLVRVLEDDPDHAAAHLMLAKIHEHNLKDIPRALEHARLAEEAEGVEASTRRIARLNRRLSGP